MAINRSTEEDDVIVGSSHGDVLNGLGGDDDLSGRAGDDIIDGGADNDEIVGGSGSNILHGGTGHDQIINALGNDAIDGGEGFDIVVFDYAPNDGSVSLAAAVNYSIDLLTGSSGFFTDDLSEQSFFSLGSDSYVNVEEFQFFHTEPVSSDSQNDSFRDDHSSHTVRLGGGNDFADGRGGDDNLFGGLGDDRLIGGSGRDLLDGAEGRDRVIYDNSLSVHIDLLSIFQSGGEAEGDRLVGIEDIDGSRFADVIRGGSADNHLFGNLSSDVLEGRAGADRLDGSAGVDTATYESSRTAVEVTLDDAARGLSSRAAGGDAAGDTLISIENLIGSSFDDDLTGSSTANILRGSGGFDVLLGLDGNDTLEGGSQNDTLDGGSGIDTATFANDRLGVVVTLGLNGANGRAVRDFFQESDVLRGIENVTGTRFSDTIFGNEQANVLRGEAGDDVFFGSRGNDTYQGGDGFDSLDLGTASSAATINLASGFVAFAGSGERDNLLAIERVAGTHFSDTFTSGGRGEVLHGGGGDDTYLLRGASEEVRESANGGVDRVLAGSSFALLADQEIEFLGAANARSSAALDLTGNGLGQGLFGSAGANTLNGGGGADVLVGAGGLDVLIGGEGADRFDFDAITDSLSGRDVVRDFTRGQDLIDLDSIDAIASSGSNEEFDFIGQNRFSGAAGELRFELRDLAGTENDHTIIVGDVNGDASEGRFQIELSGLHNLSDGNFLL